MRVCMCEESLEAICHCDWVVFEGHRVYIGIYTYIFSSRFGSLFEISKCSKIAFPWALRSLIGQIRK